VDSTLFSSVSQLMGNITSSNGGAVLNLAGSTVTLTGVSSSTLTVDDFHIA
jgi:hypothetical protein